MAEYQEGHSRHVRFIEFRLASGLRFSVLADRGMDVGHCEFNGASLGWVPPKMFAAPHFYEDASEFSWLRYGMGGLLNSSGLITIGVRQIAPTDNFKFGARMRDTYGAHDRVAVTPATHVNCGESWDGDRCLLWAEGTVHEDIAYGENLSLRRRYEAELGSRSFFIHDVVTNDGYYPTSHQFLYHFNAGFPLVDAGAELLAALSGDLGGYSFAADEKTPAAQGSAFRFFSAPQADFGHEAYVLPMAADESGTVQVAVVNRGFKGGCDGLGLYLRYPLKQLPTYIENRMMAEGLYSVGMEPATNPYMPIPDLVEAGYPVMLEPGESRRYDLEVGVLVGEEEISSFEAALPHPSKTGRGK
ncbi:MAG: DUF4432 family protein [Candidatus Dormibacteraceae bacterium]